MPGPASTLVGNASFQCLQRSLAGSGYALTEEGRSQLKKVALPVGADDLANLREQIIRLHEIRMFGTDFADHHQIEAIDVELGQRLYLDRRVRAQRQKDFYCAQPNNEADFRRLQLASAEFARISVEQPEIAAALEA